ncbi:phosphatidylinositol N-acetylglucosaminyltransferase subunit A isoform X1 [Diorhabda carinulata]|uniref:phosphatidylinositol N-acetylglucosaminyltransferase subunit A isoform X1 n=1 Tax=Diorhabda carinulata TaxID=1163345 RepID=UPI0025A0301D|nr:phosphatidylinositol N-acetylglucosaminyltransferase subunit A isoform X1 [Diorhabda carinulata]
MPLRICMVSDFFFPNMGGVEEHIYNLSQCLLLKGHKVIILTHSYEDRVGVRYMTSGLKVYYLPIKVFYNQCILPSMVSNVALIRYILLREKIDIIHGHSAFSALAHEALLIGNLLGMKTVFTDHSLFGFADASAVITNKFIQITLSDCNHCICVSHTGKENTVLRAKVESQRVSVIPNAVDTYSFTPDSNQRSKDKITVVVVSRLVYRKGVDLTAQIIGDLCDKHKEVCFLIAGDGPKRWLLEEIRERRGLQDRVTLLGSLEHSQVRNVLVKGDIFLNTSLTEAYCMAIVEAASCGLKVVSTRVGGIPEVLPDSLIYLTDATVPSLMKGMEDAIIDLKLGNVMCPYQCNIMVRKYYNWENISSRTEIVYDKVIQETDKTLGEHLSSYLTSGVWPFVLVVSLVYLMLRFYEYKVPRCNIDIAPDYNYGIKKKRL